MRCVQHGKRQKESEHTRAHTCAACSSTTKQKQGQRAAQHVARGSNMLLFHELRAALSRLPHLEATYSSHKGERKTKMNDILATKEQSFTAGVDIFAHTFTRIT